MGLNGLQSRPPDRTNSKGIRSRKALRKPTSANSAVCRPIFTAPPPQAPPPIPIRTDGRRSKGYPTKSPYLTPAHTHHHRQDAPKREAEWNAG